MTDIFNAYLSLTMLGLSKAPRRVLFLDDHPEGKLDGLWAGGVAGRGIEALQDPWGEKGGLLRLHDLVGPTLLHHAIFVPPVCIFLPELHPHDPISSSGYPVPSYHQCAFVSYHYSIKSPFTIETLPFCLGKHWEAFCKQHLSYFRL